MSDKSNLEEHADQLEEWFEAEQISLTEARKRLAGLGCEVGRAKLGRWWAARKAGREAELLLDMIARGARQCRELERELGKTAAPELELLIQLHRALILKLTTEANAAPALLSAVADLMKPVMDWARLEEKQRLRRFAEKKYRNQVAAQKAAIEREIRAAKATGGISPETLERVERELRLL